MSLGRLRATALLLLLGSLALGSEAALAQGPPDKEAQNLHVLLVIDTLDGSVGTAAGIDRDVMKRLLEGGFAKHKDRLHITILQGSDCTEKAVFDHYRKLKVGPSDALLFYFTGHGGYRPDEYGNFLHMRSEGKLWRSDLRQVMLGKRARLNIVLTDACNSVPEHVEFREIKEAPDWETMRSLFLAPRGLVDIAAVAEGEYAYCNAKIGSYFTNAFSNTLRKDFKDLDLDQNGILHWDEILPSVQEGAQVPYAQLRKQILSGSPTPKVRDRFEKQTHHTVRVYALPPLLRFGARVVDNRGDGVKVTLVHEFTPAAMAGMKSGDVIRKIGDTSLKSAADFDEAIAKAKGMVRVELRRVTSGDIERVDIHLNSWTAMSKER